MSSYIVLTNISVSECNGTLPESTELSLRRDWPRGSVAELCKEDADSLLACGAVKLFDAKASVDQLVTDAVHDPIGDVEFVPEPSEEPQEAIATPVAAPVRIRSRK